MGSSVLYEQMLKHVEVYIIVRVGVKIKSVSEKLMRNLLLAHIIINGLKPNEKRNKV